MDADTVRDECGYGDCHSCARLYGGKCDELKQAEEEEDAILNPEPEDFSDEDDGFADEPKGVDFVVVDDLDPPAEPLFVATMELLIGWASEWRSVVIDDNWYIANGTIAQIQEIIKDILKNINDTGFISVPQAGTVACYNKDEIYKIEFRLEEA